MSWLVPREDLTPDQVRAVELSTDEHRLVIGGPGSGKTLVMLHRARHLLDEYGVPEGRFKIFVFTNVLTAYIRSALDLLDLPLDSVATFDSWCCDYYREHVERRLPSAGGAPDFDAIRRTVLARLERSPVTARPFDFVLVDEAQDLGPSALAILQRISDHVTLFADRKQQIYDEGSEEEEIERAFGLRRKSVTLLDGFRCSPYITALASVLATTPQEQASFVSQARTGGGERETPLLFYARSFDEERERLFDVLRTRQTLGDQIAILLPQKRQVFGFATGMREAGFDVEVQGNGGPHSPHSLDFSTDNPKVLTYHSAKGLTFDSVLLPRLVLNSFSRASDERMQRMLFVAITRARKWVYMSSDRPTQFAPLNRLMVLEKSGQIEIQGARH